jgi:ABC-2 type transport system permease protein
VQLRNPEFDLTRAIKQVLYSFQAGGNLFDSIKAPVELVGYVSNDSLLPEQLVEYKADIIGQLEKVSGDSRGQFSFRFLEPEAGDGAVARQIEEEWGFKPMVASLFDADEFYFYLTLEDDRQVIQIPTDFDPDSFQQALDASLKRFATGFTKVVAFVAPQINPQMAQFGMGGPQFRNLEQVITENHTIRMEDISDGEVAAEADVLVVVAPENLSERAVFAIDQYLMRGGSVILVTSPYISQLAGGNLAMVNRVSGLDEWLTHHGVTIEESLVLDPQNTAFPIPVTREVGGFRFQEVRMVDYPFFVDARAPGLNPEHPISRAVPQVTLAWGSPLNTEGARSAGRDVVNLIESSAEAWTADDMDILPRVSDSGVSGWQAPAGTGVQTLGVVVRGRFDSYFAGKPSPLQAEPEAEEMNDEAAELEEPEADLTVTSVIERSPESSRLVIYTSNDFLTDQILGTMTSMTGSQYLGPLELIANTVDWALEDEGLLGIRSLAHFNRSLPPMEKEQQLFWEYLNYGLAVLALVLIAVWQRRRRAVRRNQYLATLGGSV